MRKYVLSLLLCISVLVRLSAEGWYQVRANTDTFKAYIPNSIQVSETQSVLTSATTSAFTIFADKYIATSGTCTFSVFESSMSAIWQSTGSQVTQYEGWVNLDDATTNTVSEVISSFTAISTALHVNRVEGCYLAGVSSTTSTGRAPTAGVSEGFAYANNAPNSYGDILLSTVTVMLNAVTTVSKYFSPCNDIYKVTVIQSTGTNKIATMSLREGTAVTNTSALIAIPEYNTKMVVYPFETPMKTTNNYALEFRVVYSTWIDTTNDKTLINLYK